jgi:hypothetical protein
MTTTILNDQEFNQVITGDIFLNTNTVEIDEDGNIVSDTLTASTRLTRSGIGILNNLLNGIDFTGILFNSTGFAYQSLTSLATITWANLSTKIQAISALSQASNATTLNVNNAIRIQNGETEPSPLLQYIELFADPADGHNKLSLSGSIGQPNQVLASGGPNGSLAWVNHGGGQQNVGTLAEVLNEGAIADRDIDMDNNDLLNVRVIYNEDSFGFQGQMDAQNNFTEKIAPATSQGWGMRTIGDGAYSYVQNDVGSIITFSSATNLETGLNVPRMEIRDVVADKQLYLTSQKLYLSSAITPFPADPTPNAFFFFFEDGKLQYTTGIVVANETTLPSGLTQSTNGIQIVIGGTTYYLPLFTATP